MWGPWVKPGDPLVLSGTQHLRCIWIWPLGMAPRFERGAMSASRAQLCLGWLLRMGAEGAAWWCCPSPWPAPCSLSLCGQDFMDFFEDDVLVQERGKSWALCLQRGSARVQSTPNTCYLCFWEIPGAPGSLSFGKGHWLPKTDLLKLSWALGFQGSLALGM